MDLPAPLQRALGRLHAALDGLDAAAERRAERDAARADGDAEYGLMQDDRSRLAVELDAALARNREMERAVDDVSARVERAGATVREVLGQVAAGRPVPPGAG